MKSIIIFRFHNYPRICLNRLKLLRFFNPEIPIYGIYGGDRSEVYKYLNVLGRYLTDIYVIPEELSGMRWCNFETVLTYWFNKTGKYINFDRAYVIEWDLLLLDKLENIYRHIGMNEVGLTGLIPISEIENKWYWACEEPQKTKLKHLLSFLRNSHGYTSSPFASLGPGLCFPKSYLEEYSKLKIPTICHEEIYFPLFAQLLNYPLKNTGFFNGWADEKAKEYFNCDRNYISNESILREYHQNNRKVFHPYIRIFL